MSYDDQHILDMLSFIAESIDRQVDAVAAMLRDTLSSYSWIRETVLPAPPAPIPKPVSAPRRLHVALYNWLAKNKLLMAAVLLPLGTGGWWVYQRRRRSRRKRRARRASNGARKEVVVIGGSPNEPICRTLSLDLERRGFIVYVVVNSMEDEQLVRQESRADIRPLNLDITDPPSAQNAMERFNKFLRTPQHAFLGADAHHLNLVGLIIIPDMAYLSGPIESLEPEIWSDALNVKILGTVATTRTFLHIINDFKSRILILTPSIIPSLALPFHGIQTTIVAALDAFTRTLRAELSPTGVKLAHIKLGTFDYGGGHRNHHHHHHHIPPPSARTATAPAPASSSSSSPNITHSSSRQPYLAIEAPPKHQEITTIKATPLRELHNTVVDILTTPRPAHVYYVGKGSRTYHLLGKWSPPGIVGWMIGLRGPVLAKPGSWTEGG